MADECELEISRNLLHYSVEHRINLPVVGKDFLQIEGSVDEADLQ